MTGSSFSQITPALLQSLLAPHYPDLEVHAVHPNGSIRGTASKIKVTLDGR